MAMSAAMAAAAAGGAGLGGLGPGLPGAAAMDSKSLLEAQLFDMQRKLSKTSLTEAFLRSSPTISDYYLCCFRSQIYGRSGRFYISSQSLMRCSLYSGPLS